MPEYTGGCRFWILFLTGLWRYAAPAPVTDILIHTWEGDCGRAGNDRRDRFLGIQTAGLLLGHSGGGDEGRRKPRR